MKLINKSKKIYVRTIIFLLIISVIIFLMPIKYSLGDSSAGSVVWQQNVTDKVESNPTLYNGKVYFGTDNDYLYCLNISDGSVVWQYKTGGAVHSHPVIVNNKLYFGSSDHSLYCLNPDDGSLIWQYATGGGIPYSAAVYDGKVYVNADYIYCLNVDTGDFIWKWKYSDDAYFPTSSVVAINGKIYGATAALPPFVRLFQ